MGAHPVDYVVQTVADNDLPEGIDHVVVERGGGLAPLLFIAGAPARCWTTMRAYQDAVGSGGAQVAWPADGLLCAV